MDNISTIAGRTESRKVDEALDAKLGGDGSDALSNINVHVLEVVAVRLVVAPDQVDDNVGVTDGLPAASRGEIFLSKAIPRCLRAPFRTLAITQPASTEHGRNAT